MAVNTNKTAEKLLNKATTLEGTQDVPSQAQEPERNGGMLGLLEQMKSEITKALPTFMKSDRMVRLALTAWKSNNKLKQCNPMTFIQAVLQSAQLGLEPNTNMGESYIIPRYNNQTKEMEANFQIGYKGILSLAYRTNKYSHIYAHEVYEGDKFEYELGLHKKLTHVPSDNQDGRPKHFYAVYHLVNGGYDFAVWSTKKIELHASRYAKGLDKESSPWRRNFNSMAKKTVLLDLLNYAPKSIEFTEQLSLDNTVKRDKESEPEKIIIDMEQPTDQPNEQQTENLNEEDFLNQHIQY